MQTPVWQFWTDWTVKALGTLATFLAVFVALFGSWLRNWIAPPQLNIGLVSSEGYPSTLVVYDNTGTKQHETPGFWYHVRVSNRTRWNPVTELHIFLLLVEEEDAARDFQRVWAGHAALAWRHEANPLPKKIGYAAECDLCHILKDPLQLRLSPIVRGQVPEVYTQACRIRLTLQARGLEADSDLLGIEIFWEGQWSDDRIEMKRDLVVRETRVTWIDAEVREGRS
jgi:hypothetical protein